MPCIGPCLPDVMYTFHRYHFTDSTRSVLYTSLCTLSQGLWDTRDTLLQIPLCLFYIHLFASHHRVYGIHIYGSPLVSSIYISLPLLIEFMGYIFTDPPLSLLYTSLCLLPQGLWDTYLRIPPCLFYVHLFASYHRVYGMPLYGSHPCLFYIHILFFFIYLYIYIFYLFIFFSFFFSY